MCTLMGGRADTHLAQCVCIMSSYTTVYVRDAIMCTSMILSVYAYDCDHIPQCTSVILCMYVYDCDDIPYVYACGPMFTYMYIHISRVLN